MDILNRLSDRNKQFQDTFDEELIKRKRNDHNIELRKQQRHERSKKRRIPVAPAPSESEEEFSFHPEWVTQDLVRKEPRLIDLSLAAPQRLEILLSYLTRNESIRTIKSSIECLRKIVSLNTQFPYESLGNSIVLELVVEVLDSQDKEMIYNCVWILSNAAWFSSAFVDKIVSAGAIERLFGVFKRFETLDVQDMVLWALNNIAGDNSEHCMRVFNTGLPQLLFSLLDKLPLLTHEFFCSVAWCFREMFDGLELSEEFFAETMRFVIRLLPLYEESILEELGWLMCAVTKRPKFISSFVNVPCIAAIFNLLDYPSVPVQQVILKTVGNISQGEDQSIEVMAAHGVIDKIAVLMGTQSKILRKEGLYALSNMCIVRPIADGVVSHPCFSIIVASLQNQNFEVKKEAIHCIRVIICKADTQTVGGVATCLLGALAEFLDCSDSEILIYGLIALDFLFERLKEYEITNQIDSDHFLKKFDEAGGILRVEQLQGGRSEAVFKKAQQILEKHIGVIEDAKPSNAKPSTFRF